MRAPRGLRAKLLAAVRPEFRVDVVYAYPADPVLGGPACRVDRCARVARRRGLCSGHGLRWVRDGRPDLDTFAATTEPTMNGQRPYEPCRVDGCGYAQHARRLCERHHWWWQKSGAPDVALWATTVAPPVSGEPRPFCHIASCARWAEPRGVLCAKHAVRWRSNGRPDIERYSQACDASVAEHVDLTVLEPHLRLEMQYVLQQRHANPSEHARLRPSTLQHVFRLLAGSEMPSLLALPQDRWHAFTTGHRVPHTSGRAFLTYARDQIEALHLGVGWEVEYPRQVWRLRHLGIDGQGQATISFAAIPQPWLSDLTKRWTRWRLGSGLNPNSAVKGVASLSHLAQFLAAAPLNIDALSKVNRGVLEQYLAHLNACGYGPPQRHRFISAIGMFLTDVRRHRWDSTLPPDARFYREDIPKLPKPVPRALAEHVMAQVERPEHLQLFDNPAYALVTLILIHCGLRITDAVKLPFDCIITDSDAAPYLRYYNHKMKREALVPIDDELRRHIVEQQQRLLRQWPPGVPVLFPRATTNREGRKPLSGATYRAALTSWLRRCDIRDELNQPVHLTPHQWRHTLGTRLINRDVPQEVVRRILDHDSPHMTARYAQLHDTTVRRHWEQARKINISGDVVVLDPDGPLADAAWAKQRLARATQALPNGYCGLPLAKACPHANACLACPMFLTTAEFLPHHRQHRLETLQIITKAEAQGQIRMAEMNRQVAENLDKIITALEADDPGQAANAG
jgi:integrase